MKIKNFLILGLILLVLFLLGCVSVPTCGDGICSTEETNPNSSSFCTADCKQEITQTAEKEQWAKKVYTCPKCQYWDSTQKKCVDETYNKNFTSGGEYYNEECYFYKIGNQIETFCNCSDRTTGELIGAENYLNICPIAAASQFSCP